VHAPLVALSKGDTIKLGHRLGVDFGMTWTCYDPGENSYPCWECESCRLRAKGFAEAGMTDPLFLR
jgi:7-cyano-7-deazaguanine synthase